MRKVQKYIILTIIMFIGLFIFRGQAYAKTCSSNEINKFRNEVVEEEIHTMINKTTEILLPEIAQSTNESAIVYQTLINNCNNLVAGLVESSMSTILSAQVSDYQCDFGTQYDELLSWFQKEALSVNTTINDAISSKLSEAQETARQRGEDIKGYQQDRSYLEKIKNQNKIKIEELISKAKEEYKSNLDKINNVSLGECPEMLLPIFKFIRRILTPIVSIGLPIALILMGSIDLGRAVMATDEKAIKDAASRFFRRCIAAVAVFFVVTIVTIIMNMLAKVDAIGPQNDWKACWDQAGR